MGEQFLSVRVFTKASSNIVVSQPKKDNTDFFKVYVTNVAEHGKANKAVLKLISKYLNVPVSSLTIKRGTKSRDKIISVFE